jgi:hypothetical protein
MVFSFLDEPRKQCTISNWKAPVHSSQSDYEPEACSCSHLFSGEAHAETGFDVNGCGKATLLEMISSRVCSARPAILVPCDYGTMV